METVLGASSGGGPERWYDRARMAEHLGVSQRTLDAMVAGRLVPHVRIGRRVLFPVDTADRHLIEQALASVRPPGLAPVASPRRRRSRTAAMAEPVTQRAQRRPGPARPIPAAAYVHGS